MRKAWPSFMDRRVKERLIGATILVVLMVLIVPELLSGPKRPMAAPSPAGAAEPVRNVTVDLATSKAMPAGEITASAASSPAEAPAGAAADEGGRAAEPGTPPPTITTLHAQQPAAVLENDATSPKSSKATAKTGVPRDTPPASGVHHNWAVQIGSFASYANAEKLERQLKAQSFSAFISSTGAGRKLRYRVRVGPMADRAAAEREAARLRKKGHSGSAIAL